MRLGSTLLLPLGACASLAHGTTQSVPISSVPSGATVIVDSQMIGHTPLVATLERGAPHRVSVQLDSSDSRSIAISHVLSGWLLGDLLFYGLPLMIDFPSGGAYNLRADSIHVMFARTTDGPRLASGDPLVPVLITRGDRVRAFLSDSNVTGEVWRATADSLVVHSGRHLARLAVRDMWRVQTSVGSGGHGFTGATLGLIAMPGTFALSLPVGLALGAAIRYDKWVDVWPSQSLRVTTDSEQLTGTIAALSEQTIALEVPVDSGSPIIRRIDRAKVRTVEVSWPSDNRGPGGVVGFLGGAVVGAVWAHAVSPRCLDFCGLDVIFGAWAGGIVGTFVGRLAGQQMRTDEWHELRFNRDTIR